MLARIILLAVGAFGLAAEAPAQSAVSTDPRTNCWLTTYAGKYARIYTNNAMLAAGNTLSNWSNGQETQSAPAYCGIQEVYSSTNWIYVRSTGLASYIMGPWQNGAFPNLPVNQKVLYRFPRTNNVPTAKTANGTGEIGIFVDGVAMYNSWDAYSWSVASNEDLQNLTNGYWNRDAFVNEGITFDPGYAHQQQTGQYHYHADPIALRYLLGDHVDFDATTKTYSEDTNPPTKHSPILAWTADGYPLYGPYGYSNPTNANSGIRRMVSGYVLRNGQDGTDNLPVTGRTTIPQWAVRLYNVNSNQAGPPFTGIHTNGCYMEDNDYLGDHGYTQGVDFDLDQYNGRFCVTPEFPNGTYAYFVAISSNGTPVFPYNIGRGYYGTPAGGTVLAIAEPVVTNFLGNTNLTASLGLPVVQSGAVTLTWSAIEGGSYQVESTTNLTTSSDWSVISTGNSPAPNQVTAAYTNVTSLPDNYYRVGLTSVATYDTAGTTYFATNAVAPGGNANPGQTVFLTITLPGSPPSPPANATITSVTVGGITATESVCPAQGTVDALFTIPSGATPGAQNVVVKFASPAPTFTLTGGFTIN